MGGERACLGVFRVGFAVRKCAAFEEIGRIIVRPCDLDAWDGTG